MYMNSAPHLLAEDRPEFERVLDEALRDESVLVAADVRAGGPHQLSRGQLRTMAMSASAAISACAATEYEFYRRARERERAVRADRLAERARPDDGAGDADRDAEPAGGMAGAVSGAGLFPVITVLTPLLAGTAALIFLLVGYVMAAMSPQPAIAAPLRTAGWLFLAIAAIGVLLCTVGMVLTALRDGSSAIHASQEQIPDEVTAARHAWSSALLERGMLPFLREALASDDTAVEVPGTGREGRVPGTGREGRVPDRDRGGPRPPSHLGYSRPGFSSPGTDQVRSAGPRFSSPDFSSPDFSSPDFSSPDFSSPDADDR
jgi:hypothetical protein